MRRHRIIRIVLIPFIVSQVVNFVFGAPVAVREKLEGCINVHGTEGGTAALQMRVGGSTTNMAVQMPPSLDRTEADRSRPRRTPPSLTRQVSGRAPLMLPTPPMPPPPRLPMPPRPPAPWRPSYRNRYRPYSPYRRPISPLPPPEERLQSASSSATENPSTTSQRLTPQQNSAPNLDLHSPPNSEPHPLPNSGQPPPNPGQLPPNQGPHSLPNPEQPPPSPRPHPSASGDTSVDEVLNMLKKTKIKRTFPAPVQ